MNTTNLVLPLIKEIISVKRGDIRTSQLNVITTLVNGCLEKKDLLNKVVTLLVSLTNAGKKYIRHNCLELLVSILSGLGAELEPDVAHIFESRMKQLIFDRTIRIKSAALRLVCFYLRSWHTTKKEIKQELLGEVAHLMSCDCSKTIRVHTIETIPCLDKNVLQKLIERTRDIEYEVREAAWRRLTDLHLWKYLSSTELLKLFLRGLSDKNQEVITTVEQSINDWFSRLPSTNMLQAIQQFNLEGEEDNVRKLLFALFSCQNYSFDSDYALKNLTFASAFLWLSYLQYVAQFKSVEDLEEATEKYLPTIHQFCTVLDRNRQDERVLEKLLGVARFFDCSDEAGRRYLLNYLRDKLDLPYGKGVIDTMIATVRHLFMNAEEEESMAFISSAIAPSVRSWSEQRQLLFFLVALKHFNATKQMFDAHRQLMTNGLTSQDTKLRCLAFKCWALCCVAIESLAEQSSTKLFLLALEKEKEEKIKRIIFRALFDCILLFDLPSQDLLFTSLREHLLDNAAGRYSVKTRRLLILGFCKCYASRKYQDSLILGQFILKCSSDLFEPEKSIRDLIRRFFDCCANGEMSSLFDDSFKRVVVTLQWSRANIEPLLLFYKRTAVEATRLQRMASFLIRQLVESKTASLTKKTLACIEDWIDKDEMIAQCTRLLDNAQHDNIKQTLIEFIASLSSTQRRKRKLDEQPDDWSQASLSTIISSGLPNKKPKFDG